MTELGLLLLSFVLVVAMVCASFTLSIYFIFKEEKEILQKMEVGEESEEEIEEDPFVSSFTENPNKRKSFAQELKDLEEEAEVDLDDPENESGKW